MVWITHKANVSGLINVIRHIDNMNDIIYRHVGGTRAIVVGALDELKMDNLKTIRIYTTFIRLICPGRNCSVPR